VTLKSDLSVLPLDEFPIRMGADGKDYVYFEFEIHTNFSSAHTEYSLWYKGKQYGEVDAEYA
jgi:hypothetical protein